MWMQLFLYEISLPNAPVCSQPTSGTQNLWKSKLYFASTSEGKLLDILDSVSSASSAKYV